VSFADKQAAILNAVGRVRPEAAIDEVRVTAAINRAC